MKISKKFTAVILTAILSVNSLGMKNVYSKESDTEVSSEVMMTSDSSIQEEVVITSDSSIQEEEVVITNDDDEEKTEDSVENTSKEQKPDTSSEIINEDVKELEVVEGKDIAEERIEEIYETAKEEEKEIDVEKMDHYAQEELSNMLVGLLPENDNDFEIGQRIKITGSENPTYAYFVFNEGKVIGRLNVSLYEEEFSSDFMYGGSETVQEAYDTENETLALVRTQEGTALYTGETNELTLISGEKTGETIDLEENNVSILQGEENEYICVDTGEPNETEEKEYICLDDYDISDAILEGDDHDEQYNVEDDITVVRFSYDKTELQKRAALASKKHMLYPKHVHNNNSINNGICWAAAGASIYMFRNPQYQLSAETVYKRLKGIMKTNPRGNKETIMKMWEVYNINYKCVTKKRSNNKVVTLLDHRIPIYCSFCHAKIENGKMNLLQHAVVLCGAYKSNNTLYYVYMDPNVDSYIVNNVPSKYKNTKDCYEFYYKSGGTLYNNWVRSFYCNP